jgi:hypothetical protein
MDGDILRKAIFLLRDCHESEQQVVTRLKDYFPDLALGDREMYTSEARDLVHGIHPAHAVDAARVAAVAPVVPPVPVAPAVSAAPAVAVPAVPVVAPAPAAS